jgi:hypothetical protein
MAARLFPRSVIRDADYALSLCAAFTGKGVDPPDWPAAGRQRSLNKLLLYTFSSF